MAGMKRESQSASEYSVSYSSMRGVDFSNDGTPSRRYRFASLVNMYRDYEYGGDVIESIPGFRRLLDLGEQINGIFSLKGADGKDYAIIHSGQKLYRYDLAATDEDEEEARCVEIYGNLRNVKSQSFTFGSCLYVLDGGQLVRVSLDSECKRVSDTEHPPYIPTTYYNGVAFEQRNLLTERAYEKWSVGSTVDFSHESEGLKFRICSAENKYCSVVGLDEYHSQDVHIPTFTTIAGEVYRVIEIADNAFSETPLIRSVRIPPTVGKIGKRAFHNCGSVEVIYLLGGITHIDSEAFRNCHSLRSVYLNSELVSLGEDAFLGCDSLSSVFYAADSHSFKKISGYDQVPANMITYGTPIKSLKLDVKLTEPVPVVEKVLIDGVELDGYTAVKDSNGLITRIVWESETDVLYDSAEISVLGRLDPASPGACYLCEDGTLINGRDAIENCRVCECFDGRVFLSGNPNLPNTVFYSARNGSGKGDPTYFGAMNYFNDGVGRFSVRSLLAAGDSLAVFKSGDDGSGSIFYHVPKDTDTGLLPRIYPVSYVHNGVCATGESISFFDDPVFISPLGLCALDKKAINLERSVVCRSHNVNPKLLSENLEEVSLAKWCGYLVLLADGRAYLADSRATFTHSTGSVEYEWFYLEGLGTYKNATRVYRYSSEKREGYVNHKTPDEIADGEVYGKKIMGGDYVYYVENQGLHYLVYPTEELVGGIFSPASCLCSIDDRLLLFGTRSGSVCIFNNDKRGALPEHISPDDEETNTINKDIHSCYYSFDSHAPRYGLETVKDNCGMPNVSKNTKKHSLVVKIKCFGSNEFTLEAATDRSEYKKICSVPDYGLDFSDFSFKTLSFKNESYLTLPIEENEKRWIEKSISVYTEEFASPIGIASITYRFSPKGKIKIPK